MFFVYVYSLSAAVHRIACEVCIGLSERAICCIVMRCRVIRSVFLRCCARAIFYAEMKMYPLLMTAANVACSNFTRSATWELSAERSSGVSVYTTQHILAYAVCMCVNVCANDNDDDRCAAVDRSVARQALPAEF